MEGGRRLRLSDSALVCEVMSEGHVTMLIHTPDTRDGRERD